MTGFRGCGCRWCETVYPVYLAYAWYYQDTEIGYSQHQTKAVWVKQTAELVWCSETLTQNTGESLATWDYSWIALQATQVTRIADPSDQSLDDHTSFWRNKMAPLDWFVCMLSQRLSWLRCYRKFDRLEILLWRSYFLGNSIIKRNFSLGNIIATRKFDRSQCYRSERLLLSMITLSLTPRSQSPVGELPWNQWLLGRWLLL